MDSFAHAAEIVRSDDRDRYLSDLFASGPARRHLFALHAFNVEVSRVREVVSEPGLGEIRLQYWRDAVHGDGAGHPVGQALVETIRKYKLPVAAFDNLIEARRFDLYDDPMPSLADLEGYAGDTASSLIQLAAIILSGGRDLRTADVAGHAGVAYAMTGLMRALPIHASRGQCYLPADILDRHGIDRAALFSGKATPQLRAVLAELRSVVRRHLDTARGLVGSVDPVVFPALLPVALVGPQLDRMEQPGFDPFRSRAELSQFRRQWILWRAARKREI